MRPILFSIPSQFLFVLAFVLAAALFVRDLLRRRKTPGARFSSTPLFLVAAALLLAKLFSPGQSFIPELGMLDKPWRPVPIYAYGVMLGTSMVVGWFMAMRFAKQDGIAPDVAAVIYMWTAIWAIIGSRVLHVLVEHKTYFANPIEIFKIWSGGLVAYGGMIGGFLASWYGCRKRKIPLLQWADVSAPSVVLGTAITRVGCLLFGCDYGKLSDLPWAITFPKGSPAWHDHVRRNLAEQDSLRSLPVHPTQVYEMLVGLSLFAILMLLRRYRRFSGQVFLGWVLGYGLLRSFVEIFRGDEDRGVGLLSTSQYIGFGTAILGIALMVYLLRRYRRDPDSLRLWQHPELAGAGAPSAAAGAASASNPAGRRRKKRK